jgi:hypothetical protein
VDGHGRENVSVIVSMVSIIIGGSEDDLLGGEVHEGGRLAPSALTAAASAPAVHCGGGRRSWDAARDNYFPDALLAG